jgi:predicted DNA-binding protein with PD1-like motif
MNHHALGDGRHLLRLDPGEELVASIAEVVRQTKLPGAWIQGLGSLDRAVLGFLDPKEKVYLQRTFDERMEIGALSGNVGWNGDVPSVHVHAVLSPRELLAYAGHLHEGTVGVVVEILLTELAGGLRRVVDPTNGFARIVFPGEPPPGEKPVAAPKAAEPKAREKRPG